MQIGIDLGGTKIEVAALDGRAGIRLRRRQASPRGNYQSTIRAILTLYSIRNRWLSNVFFNSFCLFAFYRIF